MSKSGPEKLNMESPDITLENVEKIAGLFPGVITEIEDAEGNVRKGIDFDLLKQELSGDYVEGREERYEFTWVGKKQSIVEANLPIQKTLRPCMAESKDWENTKNIYIEGDNLEALKLLQESYLNSVKMIYIDPPYNTGNDFIYNDKFVMDANEYNEETGAVDELGHRLVKNSKDRGRYHSDWCSMLYPRLKLVHNLLREDGVIFVSIDDHEVHNLRKMMNEVFGEENFIGEFVWQSKKGGGSDKSGVVNDQEYIVCFKKSESENTLSRIEIESEELDKHDGIGPFRRGRELNKWGAGSSRLDRPRLWYPIPGPEGDVFPIRNDGSDGRWRLKKKNMLALVQRGDVEFEKRPDGTYIVYEKIRSTDSRFKPYRTWLNNVGTTADGSKELKKIFNDKKVYDFPKPVSLLTNLLSIGSNEDDDIILDFFAGSCTTAHGVLKSNQDDGGSRQFIMVQLPEPCVENSVAYRAGFKNISDIGKERIRRAGEQIKNEIEEENRQEKIDDEPKTIPDIGFRVFKIDDTNMKDVYYAAAAYSQETIEGLVDNVKEKRTSLDLLYQVLIDWGLPLDLPHEIEKIDGFAIHTVDKNALIACFDANIPEKVMRKIAGKKPLRAVFRDGSFKSSPGKLNIEGIFKTIAPDTNLRVI